MAGEGCTFSSDQADWGYTDFVERNKITANNSGFLAADGSIVLRVDLMVENPRRPGSKLPPKGLGCPAPAAPPGLAAEFLSLLDSPDGTSDLTVIVGGGNGSADEGSADNSAAGNSDSSGGGGGGGSGGDADPAKGSVPRSFHVHRAVLAARCPFFRTLFNAGMADSAARELPLPDADPDAFAVLLRYMYGGEVPPCERAVHRAVIPLCDTLLLFDLKTALEAELVRTADEDTIAADLLWAAGRGREEVLEELVAVYTRVGGVVWVGRGSGTKDLAGNTHTVTVWCTSKWSR